MPTPQRYQSVPLYWSGGRVDEHLRKMCQILNGLLLGRVNNVYEVTLRAGETTTEVQVEQARSDSQPLLTPRSASAAASVTNVWVETSNGKVTLHHDANAAADRAFSLAVFG